MSFCERFLPLLSSMKLTSTQRALVEARYLTLVASADKRLAYTQVFYFALTMLVMIFGVLIAALITVEKISWISQEAARAVYWTTFSMSICLSIFSGLLHLFNIPKKYILCQTTSERLKAEGWAFVSEIGRYRDCLDKFGLFCSRIEKIKSKFTAMKVAIDTQATGADSGESNKDAPRHAGALFTSPRRSRFASNKRMNNVAQDHSDHCIIECPN